MPDYLGDDQRKTKQKDDKEEDKPIKGKSKVLSINPSCHYSST